MKSIPPTFEQRLLGISGINTIDPKNIEAILGTEFTCTSALLNLPKWRYEENYILKNHQHLGWAIVHKFGFL